MKVLSVAAARYFEWLDPAPVEDPPFDPEDTGIPALRQALHALPAEANYKCLSYHIFEVLSDIKDKVSGILTKFNNDLDVNNLRKYLEKCLPELNTTLAELSITA